MSYIRLKYLPRRLELATYPATVVFNNRPRAGKGPAARLTAEWIDFIHALNPGDKAFNTITGKSRGWVNRDSEDGRFFAESVSMGGNIAGVIEERGGFVRVAALPVSDRPPDPGTVNFMNTPWLVHKFTCLTRRGVPVLPGDGVEAYFPFLFAEDEVWVEKRCGDFFDRLPEPLVPGGHSLAGRPAIALRGAVVRQAPEGVKITKLEEDTRVTVLSVVRGWAKIGEQRWVDESDIRW